MSTENLHLTLAFLGEIPGPAVTRAKAVAGTLASEPFELVLDRQGLWRHSGICWAGCSRTPQALTGLAAALAQGLREVGFHLEKRPFAPHVTLLRKAVGEGTTLPKLPASGSWPVRQFVLARSHLGGAGSRYEIIDRWPLIARLAETLPAGRD